MITILKNSNISSSDNHSNSTTTSSNKNSNSISNSSNNNSNNINNSSNYYGSDSSRIRSEGFQVLLAVFHCLSILQAEAKREEAELQQVHRSCSFSPCELRTKFRLGGTYTGLYRWFFGGTY